jgi:uncharacterized protein YigA (DUF484 family)
MGEKNDIKSINEDIARRFSSIADKLKQASNIVDLLEMLLDEVENKFHVPFVWFSFIEDEKNAPIIRNIASSDKLKIRLNLISRTSLEKLVLGEPKPVLINKTLKPYYKLFPERKKYFVKSMAIVPLQIKNEIIGSWNNGDVSAERYSPDMDTYFLQKCARLISMRLAEFTASSG